MPGRMLSVTAWMFTTLLISSCSQASRATGLSKRIAYFREISDQNTKEKFFTVQIATNKLYVDQFGDVYSGFIVPSGGRRFVSYSVPDEDMSAAVDVLKDLGLDKLVNANFDFYRSLNPQKANRLIVIDSGSESFALHPENQDTQEKKKIFYEIERNVMFFLSSYTYEVSAGK